MCLSYTHTLTYLITFPSSHYSLWSPECGAEAPGGQFKPVLKKGAVGGQSHLPPDLKSLLTSQPPSTHPLGNTKEQTQPPPSCLSLSL